MLGSGRTLKGNYMGFVCLSVCSFYVYACLGCMYVCAPLGCSVPMQVRRGMKAPELELQMTVSCHVDAGD